MPTSSAGFKNSLRSNSNGILPLSCGAGRDSSTARLAAADLMGKATGALLPKLDGTPVDYRFSAEDPRAIKLAQSLTVLGLADPGAWDEAKRSPTQYVHAALKRWIAFYGGEQGRQNFVLNATISGTPDLFGGGDGRPQLLYLMVDPDSARYMILGPTLEKLEHFHPRLPASFYHLLVGAVQRCLRVYDFRDAQDRVEMLREWAEGEGDQEQYEFPDVEGCIPPSMKLKPLSARQVQRLVGGIDDQLSRQLVQAALDLTRISRRLQRPEISEETREAFMDSNPPLPALLVSFKRSDSISASFDDESQAFLEASPEPNLIVEINPADRASVQRAFDTLAVVCETMAAASRLAALLPGNNQEN